MSREEKFNLKWAAIKADINKSISQNLVGTVNAPIKEHRKRITQYEHIGTVRGMAATYR